VESGLNYDHPPFLLSVKQLNMKEIMNFSTLLAVFLCLNKFILSKLSIPYHDYSFSIMTAPYHPAHPLPTSLFAEVYM